MQRSSARKSDEARDRRRLERRAAVAPRKFPAPFGRALAIDPKALEFDWDLVSQRPNELLDGAIGVVHILGPLEFKAGGWWFDSYESIAKRIEAALTGKATRPQYGDEGFETVECAPAKAVILSLDSPGGEAAGATWLHRKIRALRRDYGVPIYAYANEMACSAAYEIASAADEIWLPDTAEIGSIGVIATAFDRTAQNEKIGLDIRLITSGAYKADSHPDRPLDDDIVGRIQAKVDQLAAIFFEVVADARGTSPEAVADLQAGTFIGQAAVDVGIADGVAGWDRFVGIVRSSLEQTTLEPSEDTAAPAA